MLRRLTAAVCALLAAAASVASQAQRADAPVIVAHGGGVVAVLPARALPRMALNAIEGLVVETRREGENLVYQAEYQGRSHKSHVRLDGRARHLAFNPRRHRFQEAASGLLVRLAEHQSLDAVIEAAGALSAKAYPALGWTLLNLPRNRNPAAAAQSIRARGLVDRVRLLLENDDRVPANVRPRGWEVAHLLPDGVARPRAAASGPRLGPLAAKDNVAPDLLASFGDPVIGASVVELEVRVLNWGGRPSTPTKLTVTINDHPDWSRSHLWLGEGEVPEIDPQSGYVFTFDVDLAAFAPWGDYYALAVVEEVAGEHPGRTFTNHDFTGFSLAGSGTVVVLCQPPASGRPSAGAADPLVGEQWHLTNSGQRAFADQPGLAGEDLSMTRTLQGEASGRGVRVAVVDTGLETCHPDLAANVEAGASHNFNAQDWAGASSSDPFGPSSMGDHGTSVAGIVAAAASNGVGGRGVAPAATLRGYNLLSAIDWARAWPDSLGGSTFSPKAIPTRSPTWRCSAAGSPTCAAAGGRCTSRRRAMAFGHAAQYPEP